jgi:Ser/Thr protein kinase RdoA (MazF antagonist)
LLYKKDAETWRCFEYIPDTYSPLIASSAEEAYLVAKCFGKFSADLSGLDTSKVKTILPGFHDLLLRYNQFETALSNATEERKEDAKQLLQELDTHTYLVKYYENMLTKPLLYPLHILHHDCKIANILLYNSTNRVYSPIDLDTTQPGYFFSDIGDMIRSMAPNIPEGAKEIEDMHLRTDFIEAVNEGYLETMREHLTPAEIQDLPLAGKILVYMQALRYVADYLNNDIYYRISYPTQNKDRAANQLRLLQLLTDYTNFDKSLCKKL